MISTRALGTACRLDAMASGLRCERRVAQHERAEWREVSWDETLAALRAEVPKIVYVHGNRVARGPDRAHGMMVYSRLPPRQSGEPRRQFVIWSWPSEQLRGPLKDYRAKAARTPEVGWQLAWALDKLPSQTHVTLSGYSYGASVVTCALHLLAGGELEGRRLPSGRQEEPIPARRAQRYDVALIAAAFDADWLAAGGLVERAPELIDRLLLVNNRYDPAMRFYHLSTPGRNARALGYAGPLGLAVDPSRPMRLLTLDLTDRVGRTHALESYLRSAPQLGAFLADQAQQRYNR